MQQVCQTLRSETLGVDALAGVGVAGGTRYRNARVAFDGLAFGRVAVGMEDSGVPRFALTVQLSRLTRSCIRRPTRSTSRQRIPIPGPNLCPSRKLPYNLCELAYF
jgi:hypothetical protein